MPHIKPNFERADSYFNINHGYWLCRGAHQELNEEDSAILLHFPDFIDAYDSEFPILLIRPHKHTILHRFLENIANEAWEQTIKHAELPEGCESLRSELKHLNIPTPNWMVESEIEAHKMDLYALGSSVAKVEAEAAFQILFQDREFLLLFQSYIKRTIEEMRPQLDPGIFTAKGSIRRTGSMPTWLRTAIFQRDKGCCQQCGKDLTHLINRLSKANYDHLLPLAAGGSNDPTNFQLLCQECNLSKGAQKIAYENLNIPFWDMPRKPRSTAVNNERRVS